MGPKTNLRRQIDDEELRPPRDPPPTPPDKRRRLKGKGKIRLQLSHQIRNRVNLRNRLDLDQRLQHGEDLGFKHNEKKPPQPKLHIQLIH